MVKVIKLIMNFRDFRLLAIEFFLNQNVSLGLSDPARADGDKITNDTELMR